MMSRFKARLSNKAMTSFDDFVYITKIHFSAGFNGVDTHGGDNPH